MRYKDFCDTVARFEGCPSLRVHEIYLTGTQYLLKVLSEGGHLSLPGIGKFISEEVELKRGGMKKVLVFKPGPGYSQFL